MHPLISRAWWVAGMGGSATRRSSTAAWRWRRSSATASRRAAPTGPSRSTVTLSAPPAPRPSPTRQARGLVGIKPAQPPPRWRSRGCCERQSTPQAAPSSGQPRPVSRAGRPYGIWYRACLPPGLSPPEQWDALPLEARWRTSWLSDVASRTSAPPSARVASPEAQGPPPHPPHPPQAGHRLGTMCASKAAAVRHRQCVTGSASQAVRQRQCSSWGDRPSPRTTLPGRLCSSWASSSGGPSSRRRCTTPRP